MEMRMPSLQAHGKRNVLQSSPACGRRRRAPFTERAPADPRINRQGFRLEIAQSAPVCDRAEVFDQFIVIVIADEPDIRQAHVGIESAKESPWRHEISLQRVVGIDDILKLSEHRGIPVLGLRCSAIDFNHKMIGMHEARCGEPVALQGNETQTVGVQATGKKMIVGEP